APAERHVLCRVQFTIPLLNGAGLNLGIQGYKHFAPPEQTSAPTKTTFRAKPLQAGLHEKL
ncbi:MAG TPA: hypothetical protein VFM05_10520, partial [Candidatus Saccharimonadales bacterium]|nr:hypothetical protein [Candidatus Saccharimonadales bacterium]